MMSAPHLSSEEGRTTAMCRLFGFRSVIQSQVHRSLLAADNALAVQSRRHPDGWGVAYYVAGAPHVVKSADTALEDQIFKRVSGVVASETVVAHLRKATVGDINILNAHPFQFGSWVLAHNGEIYNFNAVRDALRSEIAPNLRRYILGDTDSETFFYLFLTHLSRLADLHRKGTPLEAIVEALVAAVDTTRKLADGPTPEERSKLTFIVTDGLSMVALCSGKPLLTSTYKNRCMDRGLCPFLTPECEAPTQTGRVNHFIASSEALQGENVWVPMQDDEFIGVDWRMNLYKGRYEGSKVELNASGAPA